MVYMTNIIQVNLKSPWSTFWHTAHYYIQLSNGKDWNIYYTGLMKKIHISAFWKHSLSSWPCGICGKWESRFMDPTTIEQSLAVFRLAHMAFLFRNKQRFIAISGVFYATIGIVYSHADQENSLIVYVLVKFNAWCIPFLNTTVLLIPRINVSICLAQTKLEIVDQWSTRIPPPHRRGWHCSKSQGSPFWKRHSWQSLGFCLQPQRTCTWNLKLKFQSKLELRCRNHAIQKTKNLIWPPGSHLENEVTENQ